MKESYRRGGWKRLDRAAGLSAMGFVAASCADTNHPRPPLTYAQRDGAVGEVSAGGSGDASSVATGGRDAGGPEAGRPVPAYGGVVAIQDESIQNAPSAGRGLSIELLFTAFRGPDYEENPGQPTGCKVWSYDAKTDPVRPLSDQGVVTIAGLSGGTVECKFELGRGYTCPTSTGSGRTSVAPGTAGTAGTAECSIAGAAFSAADVGRYLRLEGAVNAANDGDFPIVAATSPTTTAIVNPAALSEDFAGRYVVLAGAGPIPDFQSGVFEANGGVTIGIAPGGIHALEFTDIGPVTPGGGFSLDEPSQPVLVGIPVDGSPVTLSCAGRAGRCGSAPTTVVRITTTDGRTAGASPFSMPAAVGKQVEIQCASLGGDGTMSLSANIMKFLKDSNEASAITRIRTAYMRQGVGFGTNPVPLPPNRVTALVGYSVLGFSNP